MKKILFCTGLLVLAAGCANDELESLSNRNESIKGITFEAALASDPSTRGEITEGSNGTYPFFWYAETDRIEIVGYNNLKKGSGNSSGKGLATLGSGEWTFTNGVASYKATKSQANGDFTAATDADMLEFVDPMTDADDTDTKKAAKTATFVAAFNGSIKKVSIANSEVTTVKLELPIATNAQTIAEGTNEAKAPMYSVSKGYKTEGYQSVGEKVGLKFIRPMALGKFKTIGIDKTYSELFGKLKSIKLTTKGYSKDSKTIAASKIAYSAANKTMTIDVKDVSKSVFEAGDKTDVTLTYTNGKTWTDADAAFMTLIPVDRSAFRGDSPVKEDLEVEFNFENITLILSGAEAGWATNSDWTCLTRGGGVNGVVPMPELEIASFPYLLTKSNALIVNSGKFSDIYKANDKTKIIWGGQEVAVSSIERIISNVVLTDAELADLKNFSGLTSITLMGNTAIQANTFSAAQARAITEFNMPKVTEVKEKFINNAADGAFSALETLSMPTYLFANENVNKAFFNDNTKATIETLDISGVPSLTPEFGTLRTLSFQSYTALTEVTVQNNVKLSANAFNGCSKLVKVNNVVDLRTGLSTAVSAFEGCSKLVKINIKGTEIPASAFKDCAALTDVLVNGAQVAPTKVGVSAFQNTTALKYVDLASATEIGKNAFNASGLVGPKKDVAVLKVGADKITEQSFAGVAVKMIQFTNATSIEDGILTGASSLIQVKFVKPFTVDGSKKSTWTTGMFGTSASVTLFINEAQKYIATGSTTLQLPWMSGSTAMTTDITFKSITVE